MTSAILSDYHLFNDWLDASSLATESPPSLSSSGSSQSDFYIQQAFDPYNGSVVDPNFNYRYYTPLELDTSFPSFSTDPSLLTHFNQLHQNSALLTSAPGPLIASSSPRLGVSDRQLSPVYRSSSNSPAAVRPSDVQCQRTVLKDITNNLLLEHYQPYSPQLPPVSIIPNVSPIIHAFSERLHDSPPASLSLLSHNIITRTTEQTVLERIQALAPVPPSVESSPERPLAEMCQENYHSPSPLGSPWPTSPRKRSYRITSGQKTTATRLSSPLLKSPMRSTTHLVKRGRLVTPRKQSLNTPSSPLTPLTPLSATSGFPSPVRPRKIRSLKKVKKPVPLIRRQSTRLRTQAPVVETTDNVSDLDDAAEDEDEQLSTETSSEPSHSVFTNREFPPAIEISPDFPMLYRRFPLSSYVDVAPPDPRHPGGSYNPPRWPLDLYTPRFVRGKGPEKVGLCPVCIEPHSRGGIGKKHWLAMKFSAFNYHMQYFHGISAATGRPFSPPVAFRLIRRPNPAKKERSEIQEGKCHKCAKWIPVEGVKDVESKVKELFWWKHAANCHHQSTLEAENDVYEKDEIYQRLVGERS